MDGQIDSQGIIRNTLCKVITDDTSDVTVSC